MGNALVGRLYQSLLSYNVNIICSAEVKSLIYKNNEVSEVSITSNNKINRIKVNAGVILATGGFSNNKKLRKKLIPQTIPNESCVSESATGDGIKLAEKLGGSLKISDESNSFFAPISLKKRNDNSTAVFPHFVLDRGKPGIVAVNPNGKRFVNEATTYHLFGKALSKALEKIS
jgi:succinate dehydrogenase/fumarate reductase flavoprotein subunit